jgi:hypothetical protein
MTRTIRFTAILLPALLALAACKRDDQTTATTTPAPTPAPTTQPAPQPLPAPTPPPTAPAPAITIANIDLGNAIGADNRVTTPASTFKPADTIYAAVATNGSAPSTTIVARWTYQDGQVVNESSQTIAPTGPAVTTFNIAKPDGWPVGKYKVEVLIDGTSVGQREFDVAAG